MTYARARRHNAEVVERSLRPFQEFVAFLILPVFFLDVFLECGIVAEERHRNRMVDDQIDRDLRIDLLGVAAQLLHGVAHRSKINDGRHPGEILHQHARRAECNLAIGGLGLEPLGDGLDVVFRNRPAVLIAQQIFEQDFHRKRQTRNALETISLGNGKTEISVRLATNLEGLAASKAVERSHFGCFHSRPVDRRWFGLSYWQGEVFLAGETCVRIRIT